MPQTPHLEKHFTGSELIRDIVIGMSDGLTVPFALAAGLSGAVNSNSIVITGGLAEIAAGSIAMGLGGYLAAKSDAEHYFSEQAREEKEVREVPEKEIAEVRDIFQSYGLSPAAATSIAEGLRQRPDTLVDVMMRLELGLEAPNPRRALVSALTIGGSYVAGGIIPLSPYIVFPTSQSALTFSVLVTLTALALFGALKGRFTGAAPLRSGLQTMLIGGLAAGAAFLIAKAIS